MNLQPDKLIAAINDLPYFGEANAKFRDDVIALIRAQIRDSEGTLFGKWLFTKDDELVHTETGEHRYPRKQLARALRFFAENPRISFTFEQLSVRINGRQFADHPLCARNMVRHLRPLIDDDGRILASVHGRGYIFMGGRV